MNNLIYAGGIYLYHFTLRPEFEVTLVFVTYQFLFIRFKDLWTYLIFNICGLGMYIVRCGYMIDNAS